MKKLFLCITLIFLWTYVFAEKPQKEVLVDWSKNDGKTEYRISFIPEYKINMQAPFNFFLLDSTKTQIEKVGWSSFTKDDKGVFKFKSGKNEKYVKYWFVSCRYQNNEVISCKTFSETIEIK